MNVRERIIEATTQVAADEGPAYLTLEHIAEVAGVSKGGLLYHFATKDDLFRAVIEEEIDKFERAVDRLVAAGMPFLEAYVEVSCMVHRELARVAPAFVAVAALNRDLLTPLTSRCEEWTQRLESHGVTREAARAAGIFSDGLLFGSALGLTKLNDDELAVVKRRMLWILRPWYEEELARTVQYALAHAEDRELAVVE